MTARNNKLSHADSEKLRTEVEALRKSENEFKAKFSRMDGAVKEKDAQIEDLQKQMQREVCGDVCDTCEYVYVLV
jgi:hypothetical protein